MIFLDNSNKIKKVKIVLSAWFVFSMVFSFVLPVGVVFAEEGGEEPIVAPVVEEKAVVEEETDTTTTTDITTETTETEVVETETADTKIVEETEDEIISDDSTRLMGTKGPIDEEEDTRDYFEKDEGDDHHDPHDSHGGSSGCGDDDDDGGKPEVYEHTCALPDSLGDTTTESIVRGWDSPSLQEVFNSKSIHKNVISDQKQYQSWNTQKSSTTISVEFISRGAALNSVFGYYKNGDISTFTPMFRSGPSASFPTLPEFSSGQSTTTDILKANNIGFAIKTSDGNSYASLNSLNENSNDHAAVYELANNVYIIAFEDLALASSDMDYNDIVIKMTVIGCGNIPPPPPPPANTPPVIILSGANPLILNVGDVFAEPGYTSTDAEDGDLTASTTIAGTVNTSTVSTTTLVYSVTDSGGLSASTTRVVIVKEKTTPPPTFQCSDGIDNDGDGKIDANDPGCHSDNDPGNTSTYNPNDNDETDIVLPVNTPPVITLVGANPATTTVGTTFVDPGATATDLEDGNLTSSIISTSTVNAMVVGTYDIKYSVTDSGGLSASTTRVVVVSSTTTPPINTPPVITLVGANPFNLTVGDTFVDPGATAADAEDGNLTPAITSTSTVNVAVVGTYGVTYSVTDTGGLSASTTRTVNVNPASNPPVNPPAETGGGGGGGGGGHRHPIVTGEILGATSCSYLRDYLKIDWSNDPIEVLKLQSFLNVFEKENLSLTGVYDQATFKAVERFQIKYSGDILVPWGDKVTTGFVYILTKKKVNEIYCNTVLGLSQTDQNEIDSFRNSPINNTSSNASGYSGYNTESSQSSTDSGQGALSGVKIDSPEIVVELEDNATSESIIRNSAVSLFALPQKMFGKLFNNCSYTPILLLLILIALVIIIARSSGNSGDSKNLKDKKENSPVIILPSAPGEKNKKESQILPDEEIIIENPEEETIISTPDLRDKI